MKSWSGSGVAFSVFVLQERRRSVRVCISHFTVHVRNTVGLFGASRGSIYEPRSDHVMGNGASIQRRGRVDEPDQQLRKHLLHDDRRLFALLSGTFAGHGSSVA